VDEGFTHKMVIVVRRDLKLSAGKMAAQVAHAAVDCALRAKADDERSFKKWKSEGQKKVVVRVDSERDLHELKMAADARDLTTTMISDAGLTEVPPGTVTVLGIGPASNPQIDAVTGKLPLL
jgi:PTH2 family peptidyl-tRNA hydrolase